jgi:hypothetical protein
MDGRKKAVERGGRGWMSDDGIWRGFERIWRRGDKPKEGGEGGGINLKDGEKKLGR